MVDILLVNMQSEKLKHSWQQSVPGQHPCTTTVHHRAGRFPDSIGFDSLHLELEHNVQHLLPNKSFDLNQADKSLRYKLFDSPGQL